MTRSPYAPRVHTRASSTRRIASSTSAVTADGSAWRAASLRTSASTCRALHSRAGGVAMSFFTADDAPRGKCGRARPSAPTYVLPVHSPGATNAGCGATACVAQCWKNSVRAAPSSTLPHSPHTIEPSPSRRIAPTGCRHRPPPSLKTSSYSSSASGAAVPVPVPVPVPDGADLSWGGGGGSVTINGGGGGGCGVAGDTAGGFFLRGRSGAKHGPRFIQRGVVWSSNYVIMTSKTSSKKRKEKKAMASFLVLFFVLCFFCLFLVTDCCCC